MTDARAKARATLTAQLVRLSPRDAKQITATIDELIVAHVVDARTATIRDFQRAAALDEPLIGDVGVKTAAAIRAVIEGHGDPSLCRTEGHVWVTIALGPRRWCGRCNRYPEDVADVLRALLNAECGPCADARAVLGAQDGETLAEAAKRVMRELTAGYAHEARAGAARLDAITGQPGHVGPTPSTRDTHGPSYLAGFNEGARMAVSQIADRLNLRADIESMGQEIAPKARVNVGAVLRDKAERLRRHMKITSEPSARCDPFDIPPGQH